MLYSNPKDLHAWLNQLRYDDLQRLAEKLGVNLPAVDGMQLGMITPGHLYKCQLRIMDQVDNHVDPGKWHLFLGCHYPPFKNDPPVSTSRFGFLSPAAFFNRVVVPAASIPFGLPTLRLPSFAGDSNQDEIEARVEVDCMMDLDNARVGVMDQEEGAVENETASIENLTGPESGMEIYSFDQQEESTAVSACVQLDDVEMICQDAVPVAIQTDEEAAPQTFVPGVPSVPSPSGRPAAPVRSALKRYRSSCFNFKAAHQANKLAKGHVRDVRVRFEDTETVATLPTERNPTDNDPVENAGVVTSPEISMHAPLASALTADASHDESAMPVKSATDIVGSMDMIYEPFNLIRDSNKSGNRSDKPKRVSLKPRTRLNDGPTSPSPNKKPIVQLKSTCNDLAQSGGQPEQSQLLSSASFVHGEVDKTVTQLPPPECLASSWTGNDGDSTPSVPEACQPPTSIVPESIDIVYEPFNIPRPFYFNKQKNQSGKPPRTKLGPKVSTSKKAQQVPDRAVLQPLDANVPADVSLQSSTSSPVSALVTEVKLIQPEASGVASLSTTIQRDGCTLATNDLAPPAPVAELLGTGYAPFNIPRSFSKLGKRPDKKPRTKLGSSKGSSSVQTPDHVQIQNVLQPKNVNIQVNVPSHSLSNYNETPLAILPSSHTQDRCHTNEAAPAQTSTTDVPALVAAASKGFPTIVTESTISNEEKNTRLVQMRKRKYDLFAEEDPEYMIARPEKKAKAKGSHDESSGSKEPIPNASRVRESVSGKKVAIPAGQGTSEAFVKDAFKKKSRKQHPTSSPSEMDPSGSAVTPGPEKTLWLPENHQFALKIPAAIKLTAFSDVKPSCIESPPKARLPTSEYQSEIDLVAKRAFNLSSKTPSASKNKVVAGDQRKNKKMRVYLAGKKHRKSEGTSSPLALYSYTASQLNDNGSTSSIDDDVAMEDMEQIPTRYPVLEAEWAAGDPQWVAEDFPKMEREGWKRSPALAQLGNQVTTMNAIRFAYQYHGERCPLD